MNPSEDKMPVSSLGSFYLIVTPFHAGDACGKADKIVIKICDGADINATL